MTAILVRLAGFTCDGANHDSAIVNFWYFRLKKALNKRRCGAGDDDLRAFRGAVDAQQNDANAFADGELLEPRLLALGHAGFGFAEVEDHVHGFETLDGGVEDLAGRARLYSWKTVSRSASRTF